MSSVYVTQQGDNLKTVAAKLYGTASEYLKIFYANPNILDPDVVQAGTSLVIPITIGLPTNLFESSVNQDVVTINIDSELLQNWFDVKMKFSIDAVADTFSFSVPFDFSSERIRELFTPFAFQQVTIFIGTELVFTGTVISIVPNISAEAAFLNFEGYSTPGVLNDCNFPVSAYPLEYNNLSLANVVKQAANFFNLMVVDEAKDGYVFQDLEAKPEVQVYTFLSGLCQKRGVLMNSNEMGNIVLRKSSDSLPAFTLFQGDPTILNISTSYNGQEAYTTVTGILDYNDDDDDPTADTFTATDKFMVDTGTARPFVYKISNLENGTIANAVNSKLRRGWGKRISYNVTVSGWRTPTGDLWRDNIVFAVQYPGVMIYEVTNFIVRSATLNEDHDSGKFAELELVLPQSYNDQKLERLPWQV